jgi:serine/threonine protein kinase/tetratricopeptide (TPR) repeat protein
VQTAPPGLLPISAEIFALLEQLIDLPRAERENRLRAVKSHDPAVHARVLTLLHAADEVEDSGFLDAPRPPLAAGDTLGTYQLDVALGYGGMGQVWRAHRTDGAYAAPVALKVLHAHLARGTLRERFAREGRILGALAHVHIARLLDAGVSKQRQSFLVLEYIDGQRIDQWCDARQLDIKARIAIFLQISEAVAYAHAHMVVHRDLKPSNILVTQDGVVKLLDFGIAKVLTSEAIMPTRDTQLTRIGERLLTPEYAAPEQLRGEAVTCAADVYSLGVLLFELLSGAKPYRPTGPAAVDLEHEILRAVPLLPSQAATDAGDLSGRAADQRQLRRQLRGDLDAIVARAMAKTPAERYARVHALAEDLRRYLRHEPVMARHLTRRYVFGRFVRRHWLIASVGSAAAILVLAGAGVLRFAFHPRPPVLEKKSIVLAEFSNSTGESVFDDTLRQGMIVQLEQSPLFVLVSEPRIQTALRLMGQDPDTRLTPPLGREVCRRTGSAAVLDGSIATLGGGYVLGLRAINCATGEVLDTEQVQAGRKEDVLRALGQIASSFRARVGESLSSVSAHDTPLEEATTSSLEALKAFSEASRAQNSRGSAAGIPFLERAISLDPEFAMAHAQLGRFYGDIGQEMQSAESAAQAHKYRNRASERERFFIDASYEIQVTGNLEKAEETCETWGRVYPEDRGALGFPAGLILRVFGRYEAAADKAKRLVETNPDFAMGYHILVINDIALGHLDEAQSVLDRAAARHFEMPQYLLDRHRLAFLKGDEPGADRLMALAARQPAAEGFVSGDQASLLAYHGRVTQSREVVQRAVALALQLGRRDAAARLEVGSALRESLFGNGETATRDATAALGLSSGRDAEYGAAVALALAQNSAAAKGLADDLEKRFPEDTAARYHYIPAVRALLELNRNDPKKALELLEVNVPYELGSPPSNFSGYFGVMYPVFVRGQAYLAAHRGMEAAAEFQKIIDHPALIVSDPIGALAHLELARALVLSGDKVRAKAAYANFLDLWKTADSDIPTFKSAKAEYARL